MATKISIIKPSTIIIEQQMHDMNVECALKRIFHSIVSWLLVICVQTGFDLVNSYKENST